MMNLKPKIGYLMLIVLGFICTACPYESSVPISDANIPIDGAFLGKWTKSSSSNNFFEVKEKNKFVYLIENNVFNHTKKIHEIKKYYAHLSKINNEFFLNVSPRDSLEKIIRDDFLLYKIEKINPSSFHLVPLSDYIEEQFTNSEELQRFIKKHTHLSFFYGKKSKFNRFDSKDVKWKK